PARAAELRRGAAGRSCGRRPAPRLFLEQQMSAMHRLEQRDLALRTVVGWLLRQSPDLAQDQSGDGRQRQLARFVEAHPTDVAELAGMADLARRILSPRHEEARIEATRPARRRHRAGDQVEAVERRRQALVEKSAPVLAEIFLRWTVRQRLGKHQARLFEGL